MKPELPTFKVLNPTGPGNAGSKISCLSQHHPRQFNTRSHLSLILILIIQPGSCISRYHLLDPYPLSLVPVVPLHFYIFFRRRVSYSASTLPSTLLFCSLAFESDYCSRIVKSYTPPCGQCKLQHSNNDEPDKIFSEFLPPPFTKLCLLDIELTTTNSL